MPVQATLSNQVRMMGRDKAKEMSKRKIMSRILLARWPALIGAMGLLALSMTLTSYAQQHIVLPDGTNAAVEGNCTVCGMKVGGVLGGNSSYSYLDNRLIGFAGVAAAKLRDGRIELFEGARCLFIFNTAPDRFGITKDDIKYKYVTDFLSRKMIDVEQASFVLGSKVMGPMGHDLIPFTDKKSADRFSSKHGGKRIVHMGSLGLSDVDRK